MPIYMYLYLILALPLILSYQPLPESVALMEDIVVEYITDMVRISSTSYYIWCQVKWVLYSHNCNMPQVLKAQDIGSTRGKLSVEDFLYLIRKVYTYKSDFHLLFACIFEPCFVFFASRNFGMILYHYILSINCIS